MAEVRKDMIWRSVPAHSSMDSKMVSLVCRLEKPRIWNLHSQKIITAKIWLVRMLYLL